MPLRANLILLKFILTNKQTQLIMIKFSGFLKSPELIWFVIKTQANFVVYNLRINKSLHQKKKKEKKRINKSLSKIVNVAYTS